MSPEQKLNIAKAAQQYLKDKGVTQSDLANLTSLNTAYISAMFNDKLTVGNTEIADKHWRKLANAIGLGLEQQFWELVPTPQFKRIIMTLNTARERASSRTIIGEPGIGKTMALKKYVEKFPKHTYLITINSLVTVADIIHKLLEMLNLPTTGSTSMKLVQIILKFRDISLKGGNPLIIFDEAENMNSKTMKLIKGLFDGVEKYTAIVLVGTDQLTRKMLKNKLKDVDAGPQFYRRFQPGLIDLEDVDRKFTQFFDELGIVDKGLIELLQGLCNNYGELYMWLEPVIREASTQGVPVTEDLFRVYHDMPQHRRAS